MRRRGRLGSAAAASGKPAAFLKRNRRSDQRGPDRRGGADGDHDRVAAGIDRRVGVPLPVICQPDIARRVDLARGDPLQCVARIPGFRRYRVSGVEPRRTIPRMDGQHYTLRRMI